MNQPIPRSFFNDGQRAKYNEATGRISIKTQEILFFPDKKEDPEAHEYTLLLNAFSTTYLGTNLELLDRTIDQVMEGDVICRKDNDYKVKVIGRCGDVVFVQGAMEDRDMYASQWTVELLEHEEYYIVQPNTEAMTDETAKALMTQSIDNAWQPKRGEKYYTTDQDGDIDEYVWVGHFDDVAYCTMGNCHKTEEDAALWHKKYAQAFLHVFK